MHGLIFHELRLYATDRVGPDAWAKLLESAGLAGKAYLTTQDYPDEEVVAIVTAASEATGLDAQAILRDFGAFIVPDLLRMYKAFIKPEWSALDVIQHTEDVIHRAVRLQNPGATPPELTAQRDGDRVTIMYSSPRQMCALAKGIASGIGDEMGQRLLIAEVACMHRGESQCEIRISAA